MSTTDLDPQSPLSRFLSARPTEADARVPRDAAGPAGVADATPTATAPVAPVRVGDRSVVDAAGAAGVRGTARRADVRHALLGGRPADARPIALRPAGDADVETLRFLAGRDGADRIPGAPVLLAERDGVPVAAIGVRDRRVLADPMADTTDAVDRLQARAAELRGPLRRARWAARLRRGA
ncbi:unannotated protein [freshwater metagenome]|uniref:Unannotated protein n=1 Tax=freshwater metagenome TaxID=449393 RepID=A0A6J7KTH0_9ZZZZ|nr:hypothetical protein [Actinomycetota bacterium]